MAASSKEEYLKKYLSVNAEEKKKKKKKKTGVAPAKVGRSRIVDDDVDFKSLLPENLANTLEEDVGDNEPVIADFVDERPEHVKLLEKYRQSGAWKFLGKDDENNENAQRHDSDSDQSPGRRQRHDSISDQSPPRRQRHDSDSDQSPPRRQRHDSDSDQSPQRRQRHDSDSDQSPPRKHKNNSDSDKLSSKRKRNRSKSPSNSSSKMSNYKSNLRTDSDQSPPRRRRHDSDNDQSPPRRGRHHSDSDQSPPRRGRHDSDSDQSPPRRKRNQSDSDQSPPRRPASSKNKSRKESAINSKTDKTLSGKRAGLSSAQEMRKEAEELKRKEDAKFKQISDERLGKDAATVFRDKSGRKRNLAEEKLKESEEAKKKAKADEKFQKWGKGLKQIEEQTKQVEDALHEANKPLARYKDDNDLDEMLRNMDRAEDPMLAFITKKKSKNAGPAKKEKPKISGRPPPPNRFGIMPGYRWDGVDRSNGFEKQVYAKQAERKAVSEQAYKWSVEDM
ncbi:BUD13 homolog [Mercenaria mercenaria]|uniref:BUD13 homolog n=1 Tax=Mercenaria mercenaria TaxID=6596 RepID=UPI00234E4D07|nr:BUD13 homolog [Mercenaria mercenaria]